MDNELNPQTGSRSINSLKQEKQQRAKWRYFSAQCSLDIENHIVLY